MSTVKKYFKRYFVDGMSAMALGLFSSLIVGLIISQIAKIPHLEFLAKFSEVLSASSPVVGGAIGAAIAYGLKSKPLVIFSCIAVGAYGYSVGGPVGAFVAATVANEIGSLVAGKTKIDIVVTPIVTIVSGGVVGMFVGPYLSQFMTWLGGVINAATQLHPFPMGITVATLVGLALTAPISSAAICIMLGIDGIAAGAAAVGCAAQMIGFAVTHAPVRQHLPPPANPPCSHPGQRDPRPDLHLRVRHDEHRYGRGHGHQRPCGPVRRMVRHERLLRRRKNAAFDRADALCCTGSAVASVPFAVQKNRPCQR